MISLLMISGLELFCYVFNLNGIYIRIAEDARSKEAEDAIGTNHKLSQGSDSQYAATSSKWTTSHSDDIDRLVPHQTKLSVGSCHHFYLRLFFFIQISLIVEIYSPILNLWEAYIQLVVKEDMALLLSKDRLNWDCNTITNKVL